MEEEDVVLNACNCTSPYVACKRLNKNGRCCSSARDLLMWLNVAIASDGSGFSLGYAGTPESTKIRKTQKSSYGRGFPDGGPSNV